MSRGEGIALSFVATWLVGVVLLVGHALRRVASVVYSVADGW